MPYTQNQLRCLEGMGIVPWVERSWLARSANRPDAAATLCNAVVEIENAVPEHSVVPETQSTTTQATAPVVIPALMNPRRQILCKRH